MKCPRCNGTGEINDALIRRSGPVWGSRSENTGGLANRITVLPPSEDRVKRIISSVNRLDASTEQSKAQTSLQTLRDYLRFLCKHEKTTSEELVKGFFLTTVGHLAARHKTLRACCRVIHNELRLEMLLDKQSFHHTTVWTVSPLGETIALLRRGTKKPVTGDAIIDV